MGFIGASGAFPSGRWRKKKNEKTFFIPASGDRYSSSSQLDFVSSFGLCWSAAPSSVTYGYYLYFSSSIVYPQNGSLRTYECSVRPVQE